MVPNSEHIRAASGTGPLKLESGNKCVVYELRRKEKSRNKQETLKGVPPLFPSSLNPFISDPDTCEDGLSFEMTFRLDKDALKYSDMNYMVDTGASTFNSKGFSLYTVQGNLRADIAVADQENCLQIPITVNKWQDILVTWKKSEGKNRRGYSGQQRIKAVPEYGELDQGLISYSFT